MHLHRMTVQAIGPFAGRHTIDFARLGASGLFLLEGPTGAGKSTIIDALVFALYGKVASKDASEDRLRSGHASPNDETFVDLVLETRAGVFRVRRTPAYRRAKQRGSGTTLQQATVRLWRLGDPDRPDDGELVSARLDEAGPEIQRLIGLDRTQFVQTVVLPQGEFAGFLRANPEDRRGLLQKVFGTEVYEQLQQRLERMRAERGRDVERARGQVGEAAAHFLGAAGVDEETAVAVRAAAAGAEPGTLVGVVEGCTAALQEEADAAARTAEGAAQEGARRLRDLDLARTTAAALARRTTLRVEAERLAAAQHAHEQDDARCRAARRAQAVLPLVLGVEQAEVAVAEATREAADVRASAPEDLARLVDGDAALRVQRKTLAVERDECAHLQGTLTRLVTLEAALPARREEVRTAHDAWLARTEELDAQRERCSARPDERAALVTQVESVARDGAGLAAAQERAGLLDVRVAAASAALALEAEVARAEAELSRCAAEARAAVDHAAQVQRARIAGIAGELAAHLVPGEPCTVCGGTEHPAPAALDPAHVTVETVEQAEAQRTAADTAMAAVGSRLAGLRERLEARRETAGADLATVEAELATAREAVAAAEAAVTRHQELTGRLEAFDLATAELERSISRTQAELAGEKERLAALRDRLTTDEVEVEAARGDAPTVRERAEVLARRLEVIAAWSDALAALEDARTQVARRSEERDAALAERGFADAAEVREVHLADLELDRLERGLREHEAALERVRTGLADPEVAALPEVVEVDVPAAERAHTEADAVARASGQEAARRSARAEAARTAATELGTAVETLRAAQREAGPVVRMANLAAASTGDNAKQLTLATYVLIRRFEDVVAAANARLSSMSDGRYALVRSDEREAVRTRRTGLAMKVVDHHLESERDPRTLSGGETFYVSLCLALGLADVVTAEAGGTDLGTLFVDEGFGSLDPATLDGVLAELGRLREGGRVVGVVSHVETLKQSIAERIEVRRVGNGSSTLTVRA